MKAPILIESYLSFASGSPIATGAESHSSPNQILDLALSANYILADAQGAGFRVIVDSPIVESAEPVALCSLYALAQPEFTQWRMVLYFVTTAASSIEIECVETNQTFEFDLPNIGIDELTRLERIITLDCDEMNPNTPLRFNVVVAGEIKVHSLALTKVDSTSDEIGQGFVYVQWLGADYPVTPDVPVDIVAALDRAEARQVEVATILLDDLRPDRMTCRLQAQGTDANDATADLRLIGTNANDKLTLSTDTETADPQLPLARDIFGSGEIDTTLVAVVFDSEVVDVAIRAVNFDKDTNAPASITVCRH